MDVEQRRQTAQILLGLLVILCLTFFGRFNTLIIVGAVLFGGLVLQQYVIRNGSFRIITFLLDKFERDKFKHRLPGKGAMTYAMGVFLTVLLFPENVIIQCVLIMSISDSLSTLFGKKYGVIRIVNGKSLFGSGLFFFSALFIELLFHSIPIALGVAAIATLVELLPLDDNVTVPLAVGFSLVFMTAV